MVVHNLGTIVHKILVQMGVFLLWKLSEVTICLRSCALEIVAQSSRQETVPGTSFSPIIRPLALLAPGLLPDVPTGFSLKTENGSWNCSLLQEIELTKSRRDIPLDNTDCRKCWRIIHAKCSIGIDRGRKGHIPRCRIVHIGSSLHAIDTAATRGSASWANMNAPYSLGGRISAGIVHTARV